MDSVGVKSMIEALADGPGCALTTTALVASGVMATKEGPDPTVIVPMIEGGFNPRSISETLLSSPLTTKAFQEPQYECARDQVRRSSFAAGRHRWPAQAPDE